MKLLRLIGLGMLVQSTLLLVSINALLGAPVARSFTASRANVNLTAQTSTNIYLPMLINGYDIVRNSPFGIDMYGPVDQARGLAQMQAAGAKRVVTVLDWGTIEAAAGVRDWSSFDTKVSNARAAGMDVFVLFTGDPPWAWLPDRSATDPQKRIDFVRAMVERYNCDGINDAGPNLCVRTWSFYAEPDFFADYLQTSPGAKGYWGKRGAAFAAMLVDVANVIHQSDPSARVLIGGLAYDAFIDPNSPTATRGFIRSFLPTVLDTLNTTYGGASRYIDAVAVHYYPISFPSIRAKIVEIRSIMQTRGIGYLPLLIPEAGFWSAPESGSSEQLQAQRLVQYYAEGLAEGVEQLAWFNVFDNGSGTETSGLFRGMDLTSPKPAYFAYRTVAQELAGARYVRPLNQAGVLGYVFQAGNSPEKTVVWTTSTGATATFSYNCVRIVNVTGTVYAPVNDGSPSWDKDGRVNGQITLALSPNQPLYVSRCQ